MKRRPRDPKESLESHVQGSGGSRTRTWQTSRPHMLVPRFCSGGIGREGAEVLGNFQQGLVGGKKRSLSHDEVPRTGASLSFQISRTKSSWLCSPARCWSRCTAWASRHISSLSLIGLIALSCVAELRKRSWWNWRSCLPWGSPCFAVCASYAFSK